MSYIDPNKIAEAAAKMRRPEIRMHLDDVQALGIANGCVGDADEEQLVEWTRPDGIAIVAHADVERGHMWLVDADPEPLEWVAPTTIEPGLLEAIDRVRSRERRLAELISGAFAQVLRAQGRP